MTFLSKGVLPDLQNTIPVRFDTGHAATVLEQASDEQAGLLCLRVGYKPGDSDYRFDTDQYTLDTVYDARKHDNVLR